MLGLMTQSLDSAYDSCDVRRKALTCIFPPELSPVSRVVVLSWFLLGTSYGLSPSLPLCLLPPSLRQSRVVSSASMSAWTVKTKYHRLEGLDDKLFLIVM